MPMKYTRIPNLINIGFIGLYFSLPILVAILNLGLPEGVGRFLVLLSFMLVALSLSDWYHMYISNTFKGIVSGFISFTGIAVASVSVAAILSNQPIIDLAMFSELDAWESNKLLLKMYIVGVAVATITVLSVPRLLLIKLLTSEPLPSSNSSI